MTIQKSISIILLFIVTNLLADNSLEPKCFDKIGEPLSISSPKSEVFTQAEDYLKRDWGHVSSGDHAKILSFLNTEVLGDPEFHRDPTEYLDRWFEDRGGFTDFRSPYDEVKSFLLHLYKTNALVDYATKAKTAGFKVAEGTKPYSHRWTGTPESIQRDLTDYFNEMNNRQPFPVAQSDISKVVMFLEQSVIVDPLFQNDPVAYLKAWEEMRGNHSQSIFPHDQAMHFLRYLYGGGKLVALGRKSTRGGLKPAPGASLVSSKWQQSPNSTKELSKSEKMIKRIEASQNLADLEALDLIADKLGDLDGTRKSFIESFKPVFGEEAAKKLYNATMVSSGTADANAFRIVGYLQSQGMVDQGLKLIKLISESNSNTSSDNR